MIFDAQKSVKHSFKSQMTRDSINFFVGSEAKLWNENFPSFSWIFEGLINFAPNVFEKQVSRMKSISTSFAFRKHVSITNRKFSSVWFCHVILTKSSSPMKFFSATSWALTVKFSSLKICIVKEGEISYVSIISIFRNFVELLFSLLSLLSSVQNHQIDKILN